MTSTKIKFMAEYIGIPVSKEDTNQTPESFQAVCNLYV